MLVYLGMEGFIFLIRGYFPMLFYFNEGSICVL